MILATILLMLPVVALLGAVATTITTTDVEISGNDKANVRALAAAEAGLEEARARLIGSAADATFAGDPAANPNAAWTSYILTTNAWHTSYDPHYNAVWTNYVPTTASRTNMTITANSLQTTIVYWVKSQHKREYDAEQAGHTVAVPHYYDRDGITTSHIAAAPGSLVYDGYGNPATPATAVQFTTASGAAFQPVEILTAYGNSGGRVWSPRSTVGDGGAAALVRILLLSRQRTCVARSDVCAIPPVRSVKGSIRVGLWTVRKRSPRGTPCAGTVKPHWPRTLPPMAPMTCSPARPSHGEGGARPVISLPGGRGTVDRGVPAALAGVPVLRAPALVLGAAGASEPPSRERHSGVPTPS